MLQNCRLLFSVLVLIGGISGYILGEIYLGRGNGVYMSPISALVGALLAWALWSTRRRPSAAAEEPPAATIPPSRRAARNPGNVRVKKTQQGRKGR